MCTKTKDVVISSTQTCSISVPQGHIIVNSRWQGHDLTAELQGSVPVHFESTSSVIDFYPASNAGVIYLFESDVVEGQAYKRRAARLRKANRVRGVVLVEKTNVSSQYFQSLQKFCVSDLGLNLIPVANQTEAAAFLVQMVYAESSLHKNPFLVNLTVTKSSVTKDVSLLHTLISVPGVGDTKARALVERFQNFQVLCQASQEVYNKVIEDLSQVIGKASAVKLHDFLHGC